jgi:alcohol dehydrogenase
MSYQFHLPTRLIVSQNAAKDLCALLSQSGDTVVFFLTDQGINEAGIAKDTLQQLAESGSRLVFFYDVPENPNVQDVEIALDAALRANATHVVAFGGGSVIDTAKAVGILASNPGLNWEDLQWGRAAIKFPAIPVIAVPTTAGTGSEVTHVTVIGDSAGFKKGVVHAEVFPKAAILDGSLTLSLPARLTAATGMDALVHAIEAFLGRRSHPISDLYALKAIQMIVRWLPAAYADGSDLEARRHMILAATYAGIAMDQSGLGLAHAICGPLAGKYHLHHGLGVAVLLPATLAFTAPAIQPDKWHGLREALALPIDAEPPALGEWARKFLAGVGLPFLLSEIGIQSADIPKIAADAGRMAMYGNNLRQASLDECVKLLEGAL